MQLKLLREGYIVIEGSEDPAKVPSGSFVYDVDLFLQKHDDVEVWKGSQGIIKLICNNKTFRNLRLFCDYNIDIHLQLETLNSLDLLGEITLSKAVFRKVFGIYLPDSAGKVLWRPARMEAVRTGRFFNVYKYDMNSAYASVLLEKCPVGIRQEKKFERFEELNDYDIVFAIVDDVGYHPAIAERYGENWLYCSGLKSGWFFWGEIKNIKRKKVVKAFEAVESDFVDKAGLLEIYYSFRKKAPKLKEALAALYGYNMLNNETKVFHVKKGNWKLVRTIEGEHYNILAAWFCAAIRIKLMDFAQNFKPEEVIYFGGDSVIVTKKAISPRIGSELGQFKEVFYREMKIYGLGVIEADGQFIAHRSFNDISEMPRHFLKYRKETGEPFSKKEVKNARMASG